MKRFLSYLWIASFALPMWAADIPDRPEKLKFPPLKYDPPTGSDYRVQLKSGPVVYLVPNRELPLVSIRIRVRTGSFETPSGKEGLAELTGSLLTAGAGSRSAEDLEERLAFLAARLGASVSSTQGSVSMNLLTKDLQEGLGILREVLTAPKFQQDRIDLSKKQVIQAMKQRNDDSRGIERRERVNLLFGEKFWRTRMSTKASIDSITRKDLQAFHRDWFHPANFVLAASGDFDRDEMKAELETLFSNWPFKGKKASGIPIDGRAFAKPGIYIVNKEVNQGRVSILLPGIQRDNPDYYAIQVMNDILGGGGFTRASMRTAWPGAGGVTSLSVIRTRVGVLAGARPSIFVGATRMRLPPWPGLATSTTQPSTWAGWPMAGAMGPATASVRNLAAENPARPKAVRISIREAPREMSSRRAEIRSAIARAAAPQATRPSGSRSRAK